ncbi:MULTISPECIES: DUF397 domain-containing protein [Streptomyces]|uniref:DUF397 domain-containing protein n=1 Tax=Streptomyces TaxID=1883 RepID=UPI0027E2485E|nr:DUF397 domain-containing protein [Streptomyces ginkgonis]
MTTRWQKSTFSSGGGENCLELAAAPAPGGGRLGLVLLRESDRPETVLAATRARVAALLAAVAQQERFVLPVRPARPTRPLTRRTTGPAQPNRPLM